LFFYVFFSYLFLTLTVIHIQSQTLWSLIHSRQFPLDEV